MLWVISPLNHSLLRVNMLDPSRSSTPCRGHFDWTQAATAYVHSIFTRRSELSQLYSDISTVIYTCICVHHLQAGACGRRSCRGAKAADATRHITAAPCQHMQFVCIYTCVHHLQAGACSCHSCRGAQTADATRYAAAAGGAAGGLLAAGPFAKTFSPTIGRHTRPDSREPYSEWCHCAPRTRYEVRLKQAKRWPRCHAPHGLRERWRAMGSRQTISYWKLELWGFSHTKTI